MRPTAIAVLLAAAFGAAPLSAVQVDTARVNGVVVQRGGGGAGFDPTAPRPVRRAEPGPSASVRDALPAAVFEAAPFPVAADAGAGAALADRSGGAPTGPVAASFRIGHIVRVVGAEFDVGTRLQSWRPGPAVDGVGPLARPTATLTVTQAGEAGVVAVVDRLHDRPAPGDRVRVLPGAPTVAASSLEAVSSGRRVVIRSAATPRPVLAPGDWVVLDAGGDAGLRPGDEFVPVDGPADVQGGARLQVVGVHPTASLARILRVGPTLLRPGRTVRLDRRAR